MIQVTKGRIFRQGLQASKSGKISATETTAKSHENVITLSSDEQNGKVWKILPSNSHVKRLIVENIKRQDDNFSTPHRKLAKAELPIVYGGIQSYSIKSNTREDNSKPQDPLTVDRVPPMPVLN